MTPRPGAAEGRKRAQVVWLVEYGGPEERTTVGIFARRADARLVYEATKLTQWLQHATTTQLGHLGIGAPEPIESDKDSGYQGGLYSQIGSLYWIHLEPRLVVERRRSGARTGG